MGEKCKRVNLRITENELRHIESQCVKDDKNLSEYVRQLIAQDMGRINLQDLPTKEEYLQKKALIYEINRIGNNINQIAKNVNSGIYSEYEKKKLFALMDKVNKSLIDGLKGENK